MKMCAFVSEIICFCSKFLPFFKKRKEIFELNIQFSLRHELSKTSEINVVSREKTSELIKEVSNRFTA